MKRVFPATMLAVGFSASMAAAAPWTNLAPGSTLTSNDGGLGGTISAIKDQSPNRFHQGSLDYDVTNARIAFDLGAGNETEISYVRWYNLTDNVNPPFDYKIQALNIGGTVANDADWTDVASENDVNTVGQQHSFAPVTTRAIRWFFTQDNNPGGNGNFRASEFEFYEANQHTTSLVNRPGATLRWSNGGVPVDPVAAHDGNPGVRWDGPTNGAQTVTLLLNLNPGELAVLQHLRIIAEDNGQSIGNYDVEYLLPFADPLNNANWIDVPGLTNQSGQPNIDNNPLANIETAGLRLNISDPSTNGGHEILRLWEFEVYGYVPEPAAMSLLALGGLLCARRR